MNSPTPATMATARAMAIRRSARRWSPVSSRSRFAGPCSVWRSTSTGSLPWSLSVMTSRSAPRSVSAPPGDPAGGHDQDAEAEHPGHEPLGDRPLAADGGAALVVGGGAQALDVGGDVVDVLAALGGAELVLDQAAPDRHLPWADLDRLGHVLGVDVLEGHGDVLPAEGGPGPVHAMAGGAGLPVQLAAPLEVAPGRVDVGQLGVPDRLADVDDQGVDVLVVEAGLAPLDGRALVVLPGHPAGAQHPVDGGRPADVVERRHPRVVAGPGRVGAVTGGAGVLVQLAAAGVHGLAVGRLLLGGGAGRGHPGRPP